MKKVSKLRENNKIIIIYFITSVISMIVCGLLVKDDSIRIYQRNHLWVLIVFSFIFLILIRIFKVRVKSVLIFFGVMMFLLLFLLINLDFFVSISYVTDAEIFSTMTFVAIYTTLPFQSVIKFLIGYDKEYLSYGVVPLYMILMVILSYIVITFKGVKRDKNISNN